MPQIFSHWNLDLIWKLMISIDTHLRTGDAYQWISSIFILSHSMSHTDCQTGKQQRKTKRQINTCGYKTFALVGDKCTWISLCIYMYIYIYTNAVSMAAHDICHTPVYTSGRPMVANLFYLTNDKPLQNCPLYIKYIYVWRCMRSVVLLIV